MSTVPDDATTFALGERLDVGTVDRLLSQTEPLFAGERPRRILLDASRVQACDSTGLRMLIHLQRRASATGKSLALVQPHVSLKEILTSTRLSHVFEIVEG